MATQVDASNTKYNNISWHLRFLKIITCYNFTADHEKSSWRGNMRLEGKTALITGAAGGSQDDLIGFGGAAAWLFSREGANLVLTDIDDDLGEKTAFQIRESGGEAIFEHLDVTSESGWIQVIDRTVSQFSSLDILVNNAGIGERVLVEDTTLDLWESLSDVNIKGAFLGTKYAAIQMKKNGGGSIVNISSIFGIVGSNRATAYNASKGGIRLFTKSAAIQYAKDGIRVNSVHPGFALTRLTRKGLSDPELLAERVDSVPMGRLGTADDIAYGILYLASDEASFMTGSELVIDGGMIAQ